MSRNKKPFAFFLWHRRLGLAGLLLVFVLSITGILLNHTEQFKLDETSIESDFLLDWYNINPQGNPISYKQNGIWISQWEHQLFFNGKVFFKHDEKLQGIAINENITAIALQHHVLLIDTEGEVIELIAVATQTPIEAITQTQNKIVLRDSEKNIYLSNAQLSSWSLSSIDSTLNWSTATNLSKAQLAELKSAFRGDGLNLEKFILDLHSGRIFNDRWGVYIMDAAAILMILLGLSGTWIWWSRKLKIRHKKHYQKHH